MLRNSWSRRNSVLNRFCILGVVAACIVPQLALADKPADPKEQSVPVQLTLIRDYLVDMEIRLSDQMTNTEENLSRQLMANRMAISDIYDEVTSVNLEMKTELCLDESVMAGLNGGAHGEFGVGWPNVLDAKLAIQGDAGFGVEVGLGNTICIEIPLYSVEADTWLLDNADFMNTTEFDDMLQTVAGGAQVVVPFWATVYGELMPTPEEALEALENYVIASTGKDLNGRTSSAFEPVDLLYPELLLQPVIPDIYYTFRDQIEPELRIFAEYPCVALAASPLGQVIPYDTDPGTPGDQPDPLIGFMCDAASDVMMTTLLGIDIVVGVIRDVIDGIREFLDGLTW